MQHLSKMLQSKMTIFSRGHFGTKFMWLEWPFNVLQELVLEDGIHLLDWLPASIFENKLRTIESGMT